MEKKTNTNQSRHLKLATLLFFVLGAFFMKAQSSRTNLQSISSDQLTNQEQKDKLKAQWIENNKSEYIKMGGKLENSTSNSSSRAAEFNTQAEKDVWVKSQIPLKETVIIPEIASFPKYLNTGNPLVDNENYRVKKDAWINSHQSEYNRLNQLNNEEGKKRVKPVINQ